MNARIKNYKEESLIIKKFEYLKIYNKFYVFIIPVAKFISNLEKMDLST